MQSDSSEDCDAKLPGCSSWRDALKGESPTRDILSDVHSDVRMFSLANAWLECHYSSRVIFSSPSMLMSFKTRNGKWLWMSSNLQNEDDSLNVLKLTFFPLFSERAAEKQNQIMPHTFDDVTALLLIPSTLHSWIVQLFNWRTREFLSRTSTVSWLLRVCLSYDICHCIDCSIHVIVSFESVMSFWAKSIFSLSLSSGKEYKAALVFLIRTSFFFFVSEAEIVILENAKTKKKNVACKFIHPLLRRHSLSWRWIHFLGCHSLQEDNFSSLERLRE